jgi:hypothetical protein
MHQTTDFRRKAIRAAVKLREHLVGPARQASLDCLQIARWTEVRKIVTRLRHVQRCGWTAAGEVLQYDLERTLRYLTSDLDAFRSQLPPRQQDTYVATAGEIVADLLALGQEFEEVSIDLREHTIGARTGSIVLEGLDLGPFTIQLDWSLIGHSRPYEVVAEEPCSPEGQSEVTHPHVRDQILCEGEGSAAIKSALRSGLLDFFVLVRQTLETYNPGSAYVAIDRWNGASCRDCGYGMSSDEFSSCDRCERPVCSECNVSCSSCDRYVCSDCSGRCAACGEAFCTACLVEISRRTICEPCHKKDPSDDEFDREADAAADAVCLGQAAAAA